MPRFTPPPRNETLTYIHPEYITLMQSIAISAHTTTSVKLIARFPLTALKIFNQTT